MSGSENSVKILSILHLVHAIASSLQLCNVEAVLCQQSLQRLVIIGLDRHHISGFSF